MNVCVVFMIISAISFVIHLFSVSFVAYITALLTTAVWVVLILIKVMVKVFNSPGFGSGWFYGSSSSYDSSDD